MDALAMPDVVIDLCWLFDNQHAGQGITVRQDIAALLRGIWLQLGSCGQDGGRHLVVLCNLTWLCYVLR
jgi:hypothetical protein